MSKPTPSLDRRRFLQTATAGAVLGPYALMLPGRVGAAEAGRGLEKSFPHFAGGEVVRTSGELTDGRFVETQRAIYDPELMKLVLEEMCVSAGIKIQLHTQLVGAVTVKRNRVVGVITESKSGRDLSEGKSFH